MKHPLPRSRTALPDDIAAKILAAPVVLNHAFNISHADYRCASRNGRKHRFKALDKKTVRAGVFNVRYECEDCKAQTFLTEDYTVLADFFSVKEKKK